MMVFNIVLNAVFIPRYGALGAAWVTLVSEIINIVLYVMVLAKPLALNFNLIRYFLKPALAGLLMVGGLYFINPWDLGFQIILGALIYGSALWLLGGFDEIDRELFGRIVKPTSQGSIKVTE
jgi:O-antigen/teichoic acid export membrane protein